MVHLKDAVFPEVTVAALVRSTVLITGLVTSAVVPVTVKASVARAGLGVYRVSTELLATSAALTNRIS
ncbi:hypothetical protein C5C30_12465 [Rathayibacter sp. AY2B5]|nr:hypothetical protein C5C30_12465 [Rathayibacter sp. AY2B5]